MFLLQRLVNPGVRPLQTVDVIAFAVVFVPSQVDEVRTAVDIIEMIPHRFGLQIGKRGDFPGQAGIGPVNIRVGNAFDILQPAQEPTTHFPPARRSDGR